MDTLTEAALHTGCLAACTPLGTRREIDRLALTERLMLLIYAYGTNTGGRAVAAGDHGHSGDDLRDIRSRYFTVPRLPRGGARAIANATVAARQSRLRGEGSTAVASDSTQCTAFDQNICAEWHPRYRRGEPGVQIYRTVENTGAIAVHSQLLSCRASEVHALAEGAMVIRFPWSPGMCGRSAAVSDVHRCADRSPPRITWGPQVNRGSHVGLRN